MVASDPIAVARSHPCRTTSRIRCPQYTDPGTGPYDTELIAQLQSHVKGKLAPYEYPKEIEFIESLPMTTTGKVQRRVLRLQEEERARTG